MGNDGLVLESVLLAKGNSETGEVVLDDGRFSDSYEGVDWRLPQNKLGKVEEVEWKTVLLESVLLAKGNPETGEVVVGGARFRVPYEGVDWRLPQNKLLFVRR